MHISGFSLQRPSEKAKYIPHCSHITLSGAIGICVQERRRLSHDLNCRLEKGAPIHLPQTPSPRWGLTQREHWTKSLTGNKNNSINIPYPTTPYECGPAKRQHPNATDFYQTLSSFYNLISTHSHTIKTQNYIANSVLMRKSA